MSIFMLDVFKVLALWMVELMLAVEAMKEPSILTDPTASNNSGVGFTSGSDQE